MGRTLLILLFVLALAPAAALRAQSVQERFRAANDLYWQEDYEGAREAYQRLVTDYRVDNAELYYNLANTHAKTGALGAAVLYYKRALVSGPSAETREAVEWNLERVRTALITQHRQQIDQNRMLFDESHGAWYALFHLLPEPLLAGGFLVAWFALVAVLLLRRARPARFVRPIAITLLALSLGLGGLLAGNAATTSSVRLGVIVRPDARIRATLAPDAPALALPEGLELRLLDEQDEEHVKVRLSGGREGWVAREGVMEI